MTLKIFSEKERKAILDLLNSQFGIKEIPGMLIKIGVERIFLFQGSLNENQLRQLEETVPIERAGVYFAKTFTDKKGEEQIRLSIEGSQILSNQATKNIFELDDKLLQEWMEGRDLQFKSGKKGFLLMKHKEDFLGTGKASEDKISNFIPKSRRLKSRKIIQ